MRDNRGVDRRSFAQDFFFELMRDSQRVRAVYLAERERWIRTLEIAGREEVLFELEMLLRGIDRFFNLRNLFGDKQPPADRDFRDELKAARDAVHRAAHLSRRLIVQKQEQALLDVGRALQHELFVSRYFCPPAALEFRAEYDRVSSVKLLEALRQTPDDKKRRAFALALLAAFRSLRSLRYVPPPPTPHSRRVLVILALVRSELVALIGYLETELARLIATVEGVGESAAAARAAAVPIRAALDRLAPILAEPLIERAQIDAHRDHLVAATKDAIGAIATALDPSLSRHALFDAQEGRAELSERLRLDLCVFREMCRATADRLAQPGAEVAMAQPLRRFSLEFRDVGYQLLRHSDRELFDRFLDLLESWGGSALQDTPQRIQKLREDCRRFAEILDRALENVNKRSELQKLPLDERTIREALARRLQPV